MSFGLIDSRYIDFAQGQSESALRNMTNRLGINVLEFVNRVEGAMTAVNAGTDPLVAALTYKTAQDRLIGGSTGSKVFQRAGEYGQVRPQRGAGGGWYLPLFHNAIALGFTREALQVMTVEAFESELRSTVQAVVKGQRADVLERLFLDTIFPLDDSGAGSSPGFAGTGTGSDAYTGATPPGVAAGSLNMYSRVTAATLGAEIKKYQTYLTSLQGSGPIELLTSAELLPSVVALDTAGDAFVPAGSVLVRPGQGTAEALVDPNEYVGVLYGNIRVRLAESQISGNGLAMYKSFGANASNNPLAWRYSDIWGPNTFVEDRDLFPLSNAEVSQWAGIGVNNRTAAALIAVAATGTYAANTVTVSRT